MSGTQGLRTIIYFLLGYALMGGSEAVVGQGCKCFEMQASQQGFKVLQQHGEQESSVPPPHDQACRHSGLQVVRLKSQSALCVAAVLLACVSSPVAASSDQQDAVVLVDCRL